VGSLLGAGTGSGLNSDLGTGGSDLSRPAAAAFQSSNAFLAFRFLRSSSDSDELPLDEDDELLVLDECLFRFFFFFDGSFVSLL